ncbi:MAG: hypothetical protein J1E85_00890 [Ruminococcus sp.]|nr:hypothetical protein [Ruminococcus sp.]
MNRTHIVGSVIAIILSLALMFSAVSTGASAAGNTVTLTFNATVANSIPQGTKVSIGSSLNTWNPKDTKWYATQLDETHFSLVVSVGSEYIGQEIEYKWTLQYPDNEGNGWEYCESAAGTGPFGNRKYIVKDADNVLNDTVSFPNKPEETKSTLTCGKLETIEMKMPQFSDGRKRTIRVWLPDGYDAEDSEKKYSVLYMHDGQNLFDAATSFLGEWEVDESLTKLMNKGYESTIVVGIDNGELERFNELSPSWELNALGKEYISAPAGEKYADFIVNTVKPYIDEHYNTKPQREYTGIGGSSMGGIMSLYMAMEYADVFDYGIIFSPAMHIYNEDVLDKFFDNYNFTAMRYLPKLYLFAGAKTGGSEPGSPYDEACITKYVDIIKNDLTDRNYPEQIIGTLTDKNEYHIESTWAKFFPTALQWLSNAREIPGDVNGDGVLNVDDATAIQKYICAIDVLPLEKQRLADFNGDSFINIEDVTAIQRKIAGL